MVVVLPRRVRMVFYFALSPAAAAEDSGAGSTGAAVDALGAQVADPFGGPTAAGGGWKGSKKKKGGGGGGGGGNDTPAPAPAPDGAKQRAADPADAGERVDPEHPLLFMGRDKHEKYGCALAAGGPASGEGEC